MTVEGERYALIDADGREVEEWQVIAMFRAKGVAGRAALFNVADPAQTMELTERNLSDISRFRLISTLHPSAPSPAA